MRVFVCALMLWSINAFASEQLLIPMYTPNPDFPKEVRQMGGGRARVEFSVQSDGTVFKVNILESSHPKLSEAVVKTVETWRFKPWMAEDEEWSQLIVNVPFHFGTGGAKTTPSDINMALAIALCSDVNKAVREMNRHFRDLPLLRMRFFWHTRDYLNGLFMSFNVSDAESKALIKDLTKALPEIVKQCRKQPETHYIDHLPEHIRKFL